MKLTKKRIIALICAGLCVIGSGVSSTVSRHLRESRISQQAAERWKGDSELSYAQVSVFFSDAANFLPASVDGTREMLDSALLQASIEASSKDARLWYDCYSRQCGTVSATGTKKFPANALMTAVGGDFFRMHPMRLVDGGYISPDDLMKDRVVIDTMLAWQAFGATEVAGMELTIDGTVYQIAGVVEPENDSATRAAYGETPRLYTPFEMLGSSSGSDYYDSGFYSADDPGYFPMENTDTPAIHCYEIVFPNPVRSFAESKLTDAIGERDGMKVLCNTDRGSLKARWNTLLHQRNMVIAGDGIAYPYWENAARMNDFTVSQLLGLTILLLVYPVVYGLFLLWKGYRRLEAFIAARREAHKRRFRTIEKDPYSID